MPVPDEAEGQDQAETFDETNITPDGEDIATSDMERDLFDVTSVDEDADEALEPQDDFDPDAADEAELELILRSDEDPGESRSFARDPTDLIANEDARPADFESDDLFDAADTASGDDERGASLAAERSALNPRSD